MARELIESNIEWIGICPVNWDIVPLRGVVININEKNNPIKFTNVLSLTNKLGVVPYEEKGNQGNVSKEDISQYKIAYKDTVIINSMNLKIGSVGYSNYDGCVSPVYYVLKSNDKSDMRFINYIFKSDFQKYLGKFGKGILEIREKISMYDVLHSYIPLPSKKEQIRISDYLDVNCEKIDKIIEDNAAEINLISEYKQALIDKKLLSNKLIKMKYISRYIGDGLHGTPNYDLNGEYYFVNGNNIGEEQLVFKENTDKININEYMKYKEKPIDENTILITLNGATYGKTSFYNNEKIFLGKSAGYITLNENTNKKFIRYYISSSMAKSEIDLSLAGTTIPNVSLKTLNNLLVPFFSKEKQDEIVDYLDEQCLKLDQVIEYRKQIIEKLEEYKKSLIYECVTGKREV